MLRVAGLSLLAGFAGLILVLTQFYPPPGGGGPGAPPIVWNDSNTFSNWTQKRIAGEELQFELDRSGSGSITLYTGGVDARNYAFLHLAIEDPPEDLAIAVYLKFKGAWKKPHKLEKLQNRSPKTLWLAMNELEEWTGTIDYITLFFDGPRRSTIRIKDFALYPARPLYQLRAIWSDLTGNAPWRRADMNTHTGVAKTSSFYPVPLAVSLLLASTAAYGALLLLFRKRLEFDWTVVGLIFLACWMVLDLVWQNRLLYQVDYSQRLFAGKDSAEKLAVGPDKKLYKFIAAARQHIEPGDARVFVATRDLYQGMRAAYYLYPFNAFWTIEPPEIPHDQYLRKGDYIVLIRPSDTNFYSGKSEGKLKGLENRPHRAELLYRNPTGALVRLK